MSKKNNLGKDKRYIEFLKKKEKQKREQKEVEKAKKAVRKNAAELQMISERKRVSRKEKVAPVIGSKVKLGKMLAKAMRGLDIGAKRKINMKDSESEESDSDIDDAEMGEENPKFTIVNGKRIKKKNKTISRAVEVMLKKEIKRRIKTNKQGNGQQTKVLKAKLAANRQGKADHINSSNSFV